MKRFGILIAAVTALLTASSADAACTRFIPIDLKFPSGKQEITRPFGLGTTVSGRAQCEDGTGAPAGTVGMGEVIRLSSGQDLSYQTQFVPVRPDGTFSFAVSAGPSRLLFFAFIAADNSYGVFSNEFTVFRSRVRPRLRIRPKIRRVGQVARFSGSLPGPFYGGRPVVALQARSGRKWRTFKVVPVNAAGKYSARYRFTQTSRTTVYRFRAKPVANGVDYPYAVAPSKQKRAIVRP